MASKEALTAEASSADTTNHALTSTAPTSIDTEPTTLMAKHLESRLDSNESATTPTNGDSEFSTQRISFSSGRVFRPDPTQEEIESKTQEELRAQYPADDARAMSPRRSSAETDEMEAGARLSIHRHAESLQSSLNEIADQIETVKADHARLERDNLELQNYIGGLTRTISGTSMLGKGKK